MTDAQAAQTIYLQRAMEQVESEQLADISSVDTNDPTLVYVRNLSLYISEQIAHLFHPDTSMVTVMGIVQSVLNVENLVMQSLMKSNPIVMTDGEDASSGRHL